MSVKSEKSKTSSDSKPLSPSQAFSIRKEIYNSPSIHLQDSLTMNI